MFDGGSDFAAKDPRVLNEDPNDEDNDDADGGYDDGDAPPPWRTSSASLGPCFFASGFYRY